MIRIDSITVQLDTQVVLKDFSLHIKKGEKVAVLGESGSGKSTLLKTLIGMYVPNTGTITIDGNPFVPENLDAIRKQLFYLPQDIVPQGDETVQEYLQVPFGLAVNKGLTFPEDKMNELFAALRLKTELVDQPLYKLSGGERKRVGLLQGLLLERSIIFADEPTAGVDAGNRDVIADLLFASNDTTVIAVTHDEQLMSNSDTRVELKSLSVAGGNH